MIDPTVLVSVMLISVAYHGMEQASAVIVGGGVIGASIAFHLAEAGVEDVLLVERLSSARARPPWAPAACGRCSRTS